MLSVSMITYKHESYIKQAVEGVLMQETNFEFQLIICDDCSPDTTPQIIQDLIDNHPKGYRIKYFRHEKNIGIQPNGIFAANQCVGKYIALCEGDDYWNDPQKLQKQVDFLEINPDYVMSYHDIYVVDEKGTYVRDSIFYNFYKIDHSKEQLIKSPFLMPMTMCFRNVITEFPKEFLKVVNGDVFLISMLGQYGKSKFLSDIQPASYRIHRGGVSSMVSEIEKEHQRKNTFFQLFCYYQRINDNTNAAYNFFINYKKTILRLIEVNLQERQTSISLKLYLEFLVKCIQNSLWKECAYITLDYLKLVKKQIIK